MAIPVLAAMLALQGCAGGYGSGSPRMARQAPLKCPVGYTVTCEVRKVGRIHHGSFGNNYDSCGCAPSSSQAETIPVIPRL